MKETKLEDYLGQRVTLIGTAKDAKGGAVLITAEKEPIYIEGIAFWSSNLLDKQITAIGVLKKGKFIPDPIINKDGGISTGAIGIQFFLEKPEFFLNKTNPF
ncbi:MAG: hypothetical protein ACFFAN_03180 [Promethearchaeota archaeon]